VRRSRIFLIILLACSHLADAQQKPQYTQYLLNQFIINPAITGIENYTDIKLSHRQQWVGFTDAPVTSYFTIHTPIGKKDTRVTPTSFGVTSKNPRDADFYDQYQAAEPHHGVGLQIVNDVTGPISRFSAYATYAFHMGLSAQTSIALGFAAGINNTSLNSDPLEFPEVTVDPAVYANGGQIENFKPDVAAGLYLYSADYFVGLSALQIVPQKIKFADGVVGLIPGKQVPHMFLTAGYRLGAGADWNLVPSILVKYVSPVPVQVDLNTKLQFRDLFWMGAGVRLNDGIMGMAGVNIARTVHVSYSYDYSTSEINNYSKGTHEIVLGFILGKNGDSCPRHVW
jgi:hypothetical protein